MPNRGLFGHSSPQPPASSGVNDHEALIGLLGGSPNNHWHLSPSQTIGLVSGTATALHSHVGTDVVVSDDTTTSGTMYPVWAAVPSGNLSLFTSSTLLNFNPYTGLLALNGGITSGGKVTANNFESAGSTIPNNGWTQSAANVLSFYTTGIEALRLKSDHSIEGFLSMNLTTGTYNIGGSPHAHAY